MIGTLLGMMQMFANMKPQPHPAGRGGARRSDVSRHADRLSPAKEKAAFSAAFVSA